MRSRDCSEEAHAVGAHRDAVADADGVEPHPDHPGRDDAFLHLVGEPEQVHVAGIALVPHARDAHLGLVHVVVGHARRVEHRLRGALRFRLGHTGAEFIELKHWLAYGQNRARGHQGDAHTDPPNTKPPKKKNPRMVKGGGRVLKMGTPETRGPSKRKKKTTKKNRGEKKKEKKKKKRKERETRQKGGWKKREKAKGKKKKKKRKKGKERSRGRPADPEFRMEGKEGGDPERNERIQQPTHTVVSVMTVTQSIEGAREFARRGAHPRQRDSDLQPSARRRRCGLRPSGREYACRQTTRTRHAARLRW